MLSRIRTVGSAVERFVDIEEVTGSIPVRSTISVEILSPRIYTRRMAISTSRLLTHMAWANQRVYSSVQALPDIALDSFIVNEDWTVKHILHHIVAGAELNLYCLKGGDLRKFADPSNMSELAALSRTLKEVDDELIKLGELDDEMIVINFQGEMEQNLRSTMKSQAIHHATEHRSQLVGALEYRGFNAIILDDIDLWQFENLDTRPA